MAEPTANPTERVYDACHPGGVYPLGGTLVDANRIPLDRLGDPDVQPVELSGNRPWPVSEDAKAAAAAAREEALATFAVEAEQLDEAATEALVTEALATTVANLPAFLAPITDVATIEAMRDADERVTAAACYEARLAELAALAPPDEAPV